MAFSRRPFAGSIFFSGPKKVHLGLLFIVPVLISGWFAGRWPGYALGLAASLGWLFVGRPPSDGNGIFVNGLNLVIRCIFYGAIVESLVLAAGHRATGWRMRSSSGRQISAARSVKGSGPRIRCASSPGSCRLPKMSSVDGSAYDIHDALSQMLGLGENEPGNSGCRNSNRYPAI